MGTIMYYLLLRPPGDALGCPEFYMTLVVGVSSVAMCISCWSQVSPDHSSGPARVFSFAAPFFVGSAPAFLRYYSCTANPLSSIDVIFSERYTWHLFYMVAGAVINAAKVPERFLPGCFDIYGHSHQLFHVF